MDYSLICKVRQSLAYLQLAELYGADAPYSLVIPWQKGLPQLQLWAALGL